MSEPLEEVILENGKYKITNNNGNMTFYRHGELWEAANNDLRFAKVVLLLVMRVIELEQLLPKILKDAERYQWLRNPDNMLHEDMPCVSDSFFETYFLEELDKEIDKYIAIKGAANEVG